MESNIKYINSLSLFGIACSLATMIYLYKTDFYNKHTDRKESEIQMKKSEIQIREENIEKALNDLKVREEVIINMENSFSKNNDQLTLLISSMNNFAMASDKIVKKYDDNFCIVNN